MINTIIIDDELASIQSLKRDLQRHSDSINVIASFQDPIEGLKYIRKTNFDLLFLDLEMPRMHGFELLENIGKIDFQVIFVTAYDEFALRAFEFNAVDYLLKPMQKDKLIQAIDKVEQKRMKLGNENLSALINNVQLPIQKGIQKIAIPCSFGWEFVHIDDIIYLRADGNYTKVHKLDSSSHLVAKTLKLMEGMLPFDQFFRSHQSYLVNLNHVKKYFRGSGGYLLLCSGEQIPVARAKRETLARRMHL